MLSFQEKRVWSGSHWYFPVSVQRHLSPAVPLLGHDGRYLLTNPFLCVFFVVVSCMSACTCVFLPRLVYLWRVYHLLSKPRGRTSEWKLSLAGDYSHIPSQTPLLTSWVYPSTRQQARILDDASHQLLLEAHLLLLLLLRLKVGKGWKEILLTFLLENVWADELKRSERIPPGPLIQCKSVVLSNATTRLVKLCVSLWQVVNRWCTAVCDAWCCRVVLLLVRCVCLFYSE